MNDKKQLFLGVNTILKALTFIQSKTDKIEYEKQFKALLKGAEIVKYEKYGYCVNVASENFYKLRKASKGFYYLSRKTTISNKHLKHLKGFTDYEKNNK